MHLTSSTPSSEYYLKRVHALHEELLIPHHYAERGLPFHVEPEHVVMGDLDPNGKEIPMEKETAQRWNSMKQAAATSGITLWVESAYRTIDEQAQLIRDQLAQGKIIEDILTRIAAPGYSEHHTGKAIDIGSPDCFPIPATDAFEHTQAFSWLKNNAHHFGFFMSYPRDNTKGIIYEPWHWYCNTTELTH